MQNLDTQEKEQKEELSDIVPLQKQGKGTSFSDRLKQVIGNRSGRSFAKEIGISYSTLHNYLTGTSSPTLDNLVSISEHAKVDMTWLATGRNENVLPAVSTSDNIETSIHDKWKVEYIGAYHSLKVSAGFGNYHDGVTEPDTYVPYSESLLQRLGIDENNGVVFWAEGDSMQPTIDNGDQILVNVDRKEIQEGKIYVIQQRGTMWVKRVQMGFNDVSLLSDNPAYKPIEISFEEADDLEVIGQVVHISKSII